MPRTTKILLCSLTILCGAFSYVNAFGTDLLLNLKHTGLATQQFGKDSTFTSDVALEFVPQTNSLYCSVKVPLWRTGAVTDSVRLRIFSSGTNPTNGSLITTAPAYLGSALGTSALSGTDDTAWIEFDFDNCVFLNKYHQYYFVLDRTGSLSDTVFYNTYSYVSDIFSYTNRWAADSGFAWTEFLSTEEIMDLYGVADLAEAGLTEPATTSYNFNPSTATGTDLGRFGAYFTDLWKFLFVPSQTVVNQWSTVKTNITTKLPFSYVYEFQTIIDTATVSSSSLASISVNFKLPNQATTSFNIFDLSKITQYTPSSLWGVFKTLISWGLWVAFGFLVWHTVHDLL